MVRHASTAPTRKHRSKDWVDIETLLAEGQGDLPDARRWLEEILGESSSSLRRLLALAAQVGRDG